MRKQQTLSSRLIEPMKYYQTKTKDRYMTSRVLMVLNEWKGNSNETLIIIEVVIIARRDQVLEQRSMLHWRSFILAQAET